MSADARVMEGSGPSADPRRTIRGVTPAGGDASLGHRPADQTRAAVRAAGALPSITAVVLTYNEEMHIERCLASVRPLARRLLVVDSHSTDRTAEIAERLGAEVVLHPFRNQADQFQWALDNCGIDTDWTLKIDADEYLEDALVAEIATRLPAVGNDVTGIDLRRKMVFRDRPVLHGGIYPTVVLRLWRTGAARIEQLWMDEHAVLLRGRSIAFDHDLVDHNLRDFTWWIDKHNRYATRQMADFVRAEHGLSAPDDRPDAGASGLRRLFARSPLYLRAILYFVWRYVVRLGFLDGRSGFVFHFFQCLWYRMLVDAKLDEARAEIRRHGLAAFREKLRRVHGIEI